MVTRLVIVATFIISTATMAGQANKPRSLASQAPQQPQSTVIPPNERNSGAQARSVSPDWQSSPKLPKWMNDSNWWVVIVAALTGIFIGWQSFETKRAARAALLNAQALITAERPWLVAYFKEIDNPDIPTDGNLRLAWEVRNVGRTPAKLVEAAARLVFNLDTVPLPDQPDYGLPDTLDDRILVPGGTLSFSANWYELENGRYVQLYENKLSEASILDLLVGFGYVKYRDTFGGTEDHITRFSDSAFINRAAIIGKISPWVSAPAEYTKCT